MMQTARVGVCVSLAIVIGVGTGIRLDARQHQLTAANRTPSIPTLVERLKMPDRRIDAMTALGDIAMMNRPLPRYPAANEEQRKQQAIAEAAETQRRAAMNAQLEKSEPLLVAALSDPQPEVRADALYALGAMRAVSAERQVIATLQNRQQPPRIREAAAWALAEIAGDSSLPVLAKELTAADVDPGIAWTTIDALGRLGKVAVATLTERLGSPTAHQRQWAANALAAIKLDAAPAASALRELVRSDPNAATQLAALKALVVVAPVAGETETLLTQLTTPPIRDRDLCRAAADALDRLAHTRTFDYNVCQIPGAKYEFVSTAQWTARCDEDADNAVVSKALLSFVPITQRRPLRLSVTRTLAGQVLDQRSGVIDDTSVLVACREVRANTREPAFRIPLVRIDFSAVYQRTDSVTEIRWMSLADPQGMRMLVRLPGMINVRRRDGGGMSDQVATIPFPDGVHETVGLYSGLRARARLVTPRDTDFFRTNLRAVSEYAFHSPLVLETDSIVDGPWQTVSGEPMPWGGKTTPLPKEAAFAGGMGVTLSQIAPSNPVDAERFWRAQLKHPLFMYRLQAVDALVKLGARDFADAAVELLEVPSRAGDLATNAIAAVGPSAIPGLLRVLQHPIPEIARRGAYALRSMKPPPIDALRLALKDERTRTIVLDVIGTHRGLDTSELVPELIAILPLCDDRARRGMGCWHAINLLGAAGLPAGAVAIPQLRIIADKADRFTAHYALRALLSLGDRDFVRDRLVKDISEGPSDSVDEAIKLMMDMNPLGARPALIAAANRPEPSVRLVALKELAALYAPEALRVAAEWLKSTEMLDRTNALELLELHKTPESSKLVATAVNDHKRPVRERALSILKARGITPPQ